MWSISLLALIAAASCVSCQYLPADYHFYEPYHLPRQFNQRFDSSFPRARNFQEQQPFSQPSFNPYFDAPYYFLIPRIAQQHGQITSRNSKPVGSDGKATPGIHDEPPKPETTYVPAPTNGQFSGPLYVNKPNPQLGSLGALNNFIDENIEIVPLLEYQPKSDYPDTNNNPPWFNKRSYQFYPDFEPEYLF